MDPDKTGQQEENLNNPTKVEIGKSSSKSERQEINQKNPVGTDQENINENKEEEQEKEPEPVTPYPVDKGYDAKLQKILKKQIPLRPKTIFEPEIFDITKNPTDLETEEQEMVTKEKREAEDALKIEKELSYKLQKIRESSLTGKTLVTDPLALFHSAKKVYIDQFYKISDLFVICPLYYNYRISLEYDNPEEAYYLFQTKEISPACGHTFCPNQARNISINVDNFVISEDEKETKEKSMETFLYIRKNYRCAISCFCACCSRPTFNVVSQTTKFGKIIELRTIGDPVINIYDDNGALVYIITCKGCSCGFCCADFCCGSQKCASCEYFIYNKEKTEVLGQITKFHRNGKKQRPDYDQLVLEFPKEASCQNKVLLLSAGLAMLYLYYQNNSNRRKCCGNPLFKQSEY